MLVKVTSSICKNCYLLNLVSKKVNFSSCVRKKLPTLGDGGMWCLSCSNFMSWSLSQVGRSPKVSELQFEAWFEGV